MRAGALSRFAAALVLVESAFALEGADALDVQLLEIVGLVGRPMAATRAAGRIIRGIERERFMIYTPPRDSPCSGGTGARS